MDYERESVFFFFFPLFDIYGQCWSYLWLKSCRQFKTQLHPSLCHQSSFQLSFCNNTMMRDMCLQKNTNVIDILHRNFPFLLKRKFFFLDPDWLHNNWVEIFIMHIPYFLSSLHHIYIYILVSLLYVTFIWTFYNVLIVLTNFRLIYPISKCVWISDIYKSFFNLH